jgi:hypothetical protein
MKADTKPTLEAVAEKLAIGPPPAWVIERLCRYKPLVGHHTGHGDDEVERLLLVSALNLRDWLQMYVRAGEMIGEEYPLCIDEVTTGLDQLIPILAEDIHQPKDGRPTDGRLRVRAGVCAEIWQDLHAIKQPYSERLWAACEAYWVACGHPENPSGNTKRWQRLLEAMWPQAVAPITPSK